MNKADIVDIVAKATGLTRIETAAAVDSFLETVVEALSQHKQIEIRRFGTFQVVQRAPRAGRNPKTGESVPIQARSMPVFKPAREMKARVLGS